jgi:hypothetical protein
MNLKFKINAKVRYIITGEPKVKKEAYTKNILTFLEGISNFLPKNAQTP